MSGLKDEKKGTFPRGLCVLRRSARFSLKNPTFLASRVETCLFYAVPETTIFIVVSGAHTGVVLVDVSGTTIKIVVSGT